MKVAILTTDNREHYKRYDQPTPHFGTAPEALLEGFAKTDIEVHIVSCTRRLMQSPEKFARNIHFHSLVVPKFGWLRTGYQGCIRAVRSKLREIKPDLVHGQGTERDCAITAVFSGFPNVLTLHGNMIDVARVLKSPIGSYQWLAARLETFALRRTSGVFCNSAYTEILVGPRAKKTWRVPNAVRTQVIDQKRQPPNREKCVILNVGVVCEYKQQLQVLDLAERLHGRGLPIEFHFAGTASRATPYGAAFLDKMLTAEREGYARYSGFKHSEELIEIYDGAAALIHTSTSESFGLVVAEALARNLKFFGLRLGGVPDIAENAEGAELFEPGDWSGIEQAIVAWFRAGWPRSQNAAAIMAERYRPEIIAQRHLEIYREVLARTQPQR
jgi:glycosyltransferase involved in cell wall biosynthesis